MSASAAKRISDSPDSASATIEFIYKEYQMVSNPKRYAFTSGGEVRFDESYPYLRIALTYKLQRQ
jgi:hypothetical protein